MPFAVTHVLIAIILVSIYRDYITDHKKWFTLYTVLIAGIAGLLPDIDIAIRMIFQLFGWGIPTLLEHGGITHTAAYGLVFLIPGFIYLKKEKHKTAMYFFVICFGILLHNFMDFFIGGGAAEGVMWFWPISNATYKIHLLLNVGISNIPEAMDAVLLIAWLAYIEIKHKIIDFI